MKFPGDAADRGEYRAKLPELVRMSRRPDPSIIRSARDDDVLRASRRRCLYVRAAQARQTVRSAGKIGLMKMRRVMTTVWLSSPSVNQFAHESAVISQGANLG